jgi:integrase
VSHQSRDALFRKALAQRQLEGFTFHDARATALTHMARRVDVLTLQKISGHADVGLLARVYYRESAEDVAARI